MEHARDSTIAADFFSAVEKPLSIRAKIGKLIWALRPIGHRS